MKRFSRPADIKVGVVGYGGAFNMGKAHLNQMKAAGMTPVAVAEIDPKRLEQAKQDFPGIATFPDLGRMLKECDVNLITLITPHNTHAPLALQALKAGRHIVCEKPLAITTAEVDAMLAEAKKKGLIVSTYHNRHWDGRIQLALEHIQKKKLIGEIVRLELHMGAFGKPRAWWRSSKSISGGILYDWGVHLLEYCFQLVQSPMTEVSGFAKTGFWASQKGAPYPKDANEDEASAIVRFKNGALLNLRITTLDHNPKAGWIEILGTKGSYLIDGGEYTLIRRSEDGSVSTTEKGKNPPDQGEKYYQNVADHLVKGAALVIDGPWARRPIHVLDLAWQSAKQGKTLKVKYA